MALVADQQDGVAVPVEPLRLQVHLRHQRARRVDDPEPAEVGVRIHLRRHAVGRQDDHRALGDLRLLLHEDRALPLQVPDHVEVVHDLLADVDRRAIDPEGSLHGVDGSLHARAVAARPGQQDSAGHGFMVPGGVRRPDPAPGSRRSLHVDPR